MIDQFPYKYKGSILHILADLSLVVIIVFGQTADLNRLNQTINSYDVAYKEQNCAITFKKTSNKLLSYVSPSQIRSSQLLNLHKALQPMVLP